jgi:hypothetical protein
MLLARKDLGKPISWHEIGWLLLNQYASSRHLLPQPMLVDIHMSQSCEQLVLLLGNNTYSLKVVAEDCWRHLQIQLDVFKQSIPCL